MKICVPIEENKGIESEVYNHFGTAKLFLIYNDENEDIKIIENTDINHTHGMCQPLKAIGGENVNIVLVGGIGAGALSKLANQDIRVYKAVENTVLENIKLFNNNELIEFSAKNSCDHHDCNH